MKDILTDIVSHTYTLGNIPLVKITSSEAETIIESMSEDKNVIINAKTNTPVQEFTGTFGMPNLDKLNLHLKNPEYKENAKIELVISSKDGEEFPTGIHFENAAGDFVNDYRLMAKQYVNEKLKSLKFKGTQWDVEFEPNMAAIARLKLQAAAHSEETNFQVKTENGNLVFVFGDSSTHAGSFVFEAGVDTKLKQTWAWPIAQVISILGLDGNKIIKIADAGAMMISVDSGLASYDYILPAQTK